MPARSIPWGRLVAEGLVIVAGVLIALAADRWTTRMDERDQETAYLQQLLTDFEDADSILRDAAAVASDRQAGAELLVAASRGELPDSVTARELLLGMNLAHWLLDPPVPRNAWSDLVATGRVALIESEEIRREIAGFYRHVDQQSGFHLEWLSFVRPYRDRVQALIGPELQLAIAQYRIDGTPLPDTLIPSRDGLVRAIRSDPALGSVVGEVVVTNWAGSWQYEQLYELSGEIVDMLRSELQ